MISDGERRAEAARLRQFLSMSQSEHACGYDGLQTVGSLVGTSVGENILARLADLIDRPTCHDTGERVNSFTCSSCGFYEEKIMFNPFTYSFRGLKPDWNYCPNCGAEVQE